MSSFRLCLFLASLGDGILALLAPTQILIDSCIDYLLCLPATSFLTKIGKIDRDERRGEVLRNNSDVGQYIRNRRTMVS